MTSADAVIQAKRFGCSVTAGLVAGAANLVWLRFQSLRRFRFRIRHKPHGDHPCQMAGKIYIRFGSEIFVEHSLLSSFNMFQLFKNRVHDRFTIFGVCLATVATRSSL